MSQKEALKVFKTLHRTKQLIFQGDMRTLEAGRKRINDEFKKNKHVKDPNSIKELITLAHSVEKELRTSVIQATEKKPGIFELKITQETNKFDNIPLLNNCSKK